MTALLHDLALPHDEDNIIRVPDRLQLVGDDDRGPVLGGFVERLLYDAFGVRV